MNAERTFLVFVAGCVTYASMAACSGGGDTSPGTGGTTTASPAQGGGTSRGAGANGAAGGGDGHGGSGAGDGHGGSGAGAGPSAGGSGGGGGGGNGMRLKRKFQASVDGSKDDDLVVLDWSEPLSLSRDKPAHRWYDSERDEDCVFRPTADGKMRCLPVEFSIQRIYYKSGNDCVRVAIVFDGQCTAHDYAVDFDSPLCALAEGTLPVSHVHSLGGSIGSDQCVYQDAACSDFACYGGTAKIYAFGPEVPLDAFVAGAPMTDP